jgi:hypothetical protein
MMRALTLAATLLASAMYAQTAPRPPPPPAAQKQPPLSKEDAELVEQLALLERFELVKNLDLFVQEQDAGEPKDEPQRQQ